MDLTAASEGQAKPRPSRLRLVLLAGVVVIAAAAAFRFSPWAREYQLKRASLAVLQGWAAENPKDALLQYYLGTQYHNAGTAPEALTAFERAVALDPRMTRAYVGIAAVRLKLGQFPEAQEAAKRAVELEPHSTDARFLLATTLYTQSKTQALLEFQKLTDLAPKNAEAWHWRGLCSKELNDFAGALGPLQTAVSLDPANGSYQRDLGAVLMDLGRFDEARQHLQRANQISPADAEATYLLARNLSTSAQNDADLEKAADLMGRSVQLLKGDDPKNMAAVMVEWAEVLRQLKRPKDAYKVLTEARKIDPTNHRIFHYLGVTSRALGHDAEADRWLALYGRLNRESTELSNMEQRVKQDNKNPTLRVRLAELYERAGNLPFALNQYNVCLSMDPGNTQARRGRTALIEKFKQMQAKRAGTPGNPPSP